MVFYNVKVQQDIKGLVSFQLWQQGNLLQNYHKKGEDRYAPSEVNLALISMEPDKH